MVSRLSQIGAAIAALAVSACGASDRQAPTIDLPLTAPEGTNRIVKDFLEICSLSVNDIDTAIEALDRSFWLVDQSANQTVEMMGGHQSESIRSASFQIIPIDFPHADGVTCQVLNPDAETMPDFAELSNLEGFQGAIEEFGIGPSASRIGRFSAIAPDGYPVTVQLFVRGERFYNLSMTTMRPRQPSESNQE